MIKNDKKSFNFFKTIIDDLDHDNYQYLFFNQYNHRNYFLDFKNKIISNKKDNIDIIYAFRLYKFDFKTFVKSESQSEYIINCVLDHEAFLFTKETINYAYLEKGFISYAILSDFFNDIKIDLNEHTTYFEKENHVNKFFKNNGISMYKKDKLILLDQFLYKNEAVIFDKNSHTKLSPYANVENYKEILFLNSILHNPQFFEEDFVFQEELIKNLFNRILINIVDNQYKINKNNISDQFFLITESIDILIYHMDLLELYIKHLYHLLINLFPTLDQDIKKLLLTIIKNCNKKAKTKKINIKLLSKLYFL